MLCSLSRLYILMHYRFCERMQPPGLKDYFFSNSCEFWKQKHSCNNFSLLFLVKYSLHLETKSNSLLALWKFLCIERKKISDSTNLKSYLMFWCIFRFKVCSKEIIIRFWKKYLRHHLETCKRKNLKISKDLQSRGKQ